ncbi:MAG: hypothetical protein JSS87_12530 [Acidobacteria bacterium]|nr:hypothetical protein [Acidobacteriota bacterium]
MRRIAAVLGLVSVLALVGCKSKYIEATLENRSGETLSLIQVEYPSASFGEQTLPPNASFHYRFKLIGSGPVKVTWVDPQRQEHKQEGPNLLEGEQGRLAVVFDKTDHVNFAATVHP